MINFKIYENIIYPVVYEYAFLVIGKDLTKLSSTLIINSICILH